MSRWKISSLSVVFSLLATNAVVGDENVIGRTPTSSEIALFDIDVRPDGMGLPVGQGSVADGEELYDDKCASCHGTFGEGSERYPALAGGQNTLDQERPMKTIGSYWPYAAPLFDYTWKSVV